MIGLNRNQVRNKIMKLSVTFISIAMFMLLISLTGKQEIQMEYIQRAIFWALAAIYFKLGERNNES